MTDGSSCRGGSARASVRLCRARPHSLASDLGESTPAGVSAGENLRRRWKFWRIALRVRCGNRRSCRRAWCWLALHNGAQLLAQAYAGHNCGLESEPGASRPGSAEWEQWLGQRERAVVCSLRRDGLRRLVSALVARW